MIVGKFVHSDTVARETFLISRVFVLMDKERSAWLETGRAETAFTPPLQLSKALKAPVRTK